MKNVFVRVTDADQQRVAEAAKRLEVRRPLVYQNAVSMGLDLAISKLEKIHADSN